MYVYTMIIYCPVLPKSLTRIAAVHRPVQTYNVIYRVTATDTVFFTVSSVETKSPSNWTTMSMML